MPVGHLFFRSDIKTVKVTSAQRAKKVVNPALQPKPIATAKVVNIMKNRRKVPLSLIAVAPVENPQLHPPGELHSF